MSILRLGRAEIKVMDLDEAVSYYSDVLGLYETGREENRVYFKTWDEWDHHSLVVTKADSPGLDHLAFKVESAIDLEDYEKKIEDFGLTTRRVSRGTRLAEGEALRFILPTGHHMELYYEIEKLGTNTGTLNPDPWPDNLKGMEPSRLDHSLLIGDDLESVTRFFTDVLDFKQSERVISVDGETLVGSFLFRTNTAHDIAFVKGPDGKLHHIGFYLDEWHQVLKAADIITKNNVMLDEGPTRHGITRGTTVYFFDPSGNRNEVFCGGYMTYRDFPTITWTEDQIGKAIFYHRRELNERFITALT